jgi:hypothetical protein
MWRVNTLVLDCIDNWDIVTLCFITPIKEVCLNWQNFIGYRYRYNGGLKNGNFVVKIYRCFTVKTVKISKATWYNYRATSTSLLALVQSEVSIHKATSLPSKFRVPTEFWNWGYNCCFFLNFVPLHIESTYNFGGTGPILGVKNPLQRVRAHVGGQRSCLVDAHFALY